MDLRLLPGSQEMDTQGSCEKWLKFKSWGAKKNLKIS